MTLRLETTDVTNRWDFDLYIDGQWTGGDDEHRTEVIDPATEAVIGSVPDGGAKAAGLAVEAARRAFDEGPWPFTKPAERAAVLHAMADALEARSAEIHDLIVAETGSVGLVTDLYQGIGSVGMLHSVADVIKHRVSWVEHIGTPTAGAGAVQGSALFREPVGVVAAITPFNYPFNINLMKVSSALAAGCSIVLKPHPWTPLDAMLIAQAGADAGLPPGVLNVVTGGVDAGTELTNHAAVDMISFTGATTTGRQIMASAAQSVKRVQLELGGKSAMVILEDVSEDYVRNIGFGYVLMHCGQGCVLQTRLLLPEHLLDAYLSGVEDAKAGVVIGDPRDPNTTLGPLTRDEQRQRVEKYVQIGLDEGARLITGGRRPELDKGFFYEPTILVGDNHMRVAQEEIFGPVLTVIPYRGGDAEAVRLANESIYGLSGGVFASSTSRAFDVARRIRTGAVTATGVGGQATPDVGPGGGQGPGWGWAPAGIGQEGAFGGFKQSGIGREWSRHGVEDFTEVKQLSWS